jgi:hypothetical protein
MADIERLVGAGVTMGTAKMFGLGPGGKASLLAQTVCDE